MKVTSQRIEALREAANEVRGYALKHPEGSAQRLELELIAARLMTKAEAESERPDRLTWPRP